MSRIVTVGTFDGLHRGHMLVLDMLREEGLRLGLEPMVVSFDRHPLETVAPDRAPGLLMAPDRRDMLIRRAGVGVRRVAFTEEVRRKSAAEWMHELSVVYGAKVLLLGYDNTFGSDGLTLKIEDFRAIGRKEGIRVEIAPVVEGCSSSAVRKAVTEGRVEDATRMLGRGFSITGTVGQGRHIGRTIGFPTANVGYGSRQVLPATGVYQASVRLGKDTYRAVVNVGRRPTVSSCDSVGIEAHIISFDGNIYGREIEVVFEKRLRDEKKFDSLESLRSQIREDIERVKAG